MSQLRSGAVTPNSTRRSLLVGASATLLCAPCIVRAASLMPVQGIVFPTERNYYGFLERLYVHANLPTIVELQHGGLSAHGVAAVMNSRGRKSINGDAWDAQRVIGVLTRNEKIRREDAIRRAEKMLSPS